jgi:hypothetical protein
MVAWRNEGILTMNGTVSIHAKGTLFARLALCLARGGDATGAAPIATSLYGENSAIAKILVKAAVAPGGLSNPSWDDIADYRFAAADFIDAVRPATILGKLAGVRRIPPRVRVPRATSGSTVSWVGEASPSPVSGLSLDTVTFDSFKMSGIVVATKELTRLSTPAAEGLIRTDLIAATVAVADQSFIDPDLAGEAGVSPASITNGVTPIAATGTTAAALRADLTSLFRAVTDAGILLQSPYLITDRRQAIALALMDSTLTENVTVNGGMLAGVPLLTSASVPTDSDGASPPALTSTITLIDAAELLVSDGDEATIDRSDQATLQMNTAPDSPATASTVMVSLWQDNLAAWKVTRSINWKLRRPGAVAMISGAAYAE